MLLTLGMFSDFFKKPCEIKTLVMGINAGISQYHLVTTERDLLEQTLAGSVKTYEITKIIGA